MATAAIASHHGSAHDGGKHHPNYVAIFIWLVILTFIEVSIPEVIHIKTKGPNSALPTVITASDTASYSPELKGAADLIAPHETFEAVPWSVKIGVLAILAVIKAALVGAFFMHMKFDGWKLNFIMAVPTILFLVIIVLLFPDVGIHWPQAYP